MPARKTVRPLRYRQIHLDFHTSEYIPGVGAEFDPAEFVATLKRAHVNSITLFAKCHHGWSYYPTKVGAPHPHLARPDLLGDMIAACNAADIETPVYITVQWDERNARLHPEWRVMSATNALNNALPGDVSAMNQLSPAWHTLCLNHAELRAEIAATAREVLTRYPTVPGLFFDIIQPPDCVCPACIDRMLKHGLDPEKPADRRQNDEAVNDFFRRELSGLIRAEFPDSRIFYNSGHISKYGNGRYEPYSHLELESLPTGGWGYNHFPSSARYAARLGIDFVSHTGKFHTSWGEFGGFKHPEALDYECAMMAALGSKCLIGDQLHPIGRINADTYRTIEPAYRRIEALEPYLEGAEQVSEIAILSAEYFDRSGNGPRHTPDDGAVQMLLELHRPFDIIDPEMDFGRYRLLILPDQIPVAGTLKAKLDAYLADGGRLLLTGQSGRDPETGAYAFDTGLEPIGACVATTPSYAMVTGNLQDTRLPAAPFVVYAGADQLRATNAVVLADIRPAYFDRTFAHFCSHQHTPDDPDAPSAGVAAAIKGAIGVIAYPVFETYRAIGQPLYKYLVDALIERLAPRQALVTTLPSAGRASLTFQQAEKRLIVHLLYGVPQVRGQSVYAAWDKLPRPMEMIEDVPALGPVTFMLRGKGEPKAVYDAVTGERFAWRKAGDGTIAVDLPGLKIHRAIVVDGVVPR
ncbi:conserved hypothetical protein [uncultured Pleomorphomonas sp.]|uniref:Beta-galactosidase trimerisation domain-containing protein n=1 Tax=uncultured Pleomorphomonas sp. TaxID=442121 RepID=A0A212LGV8_9HYPH|nr:alpha-amylase family protein [uncultured Pleomorphomonas sp.]SCM76801.1 conserved hypothetical protein [uncultured Pleomorphomonas sp.]